MSTVTCLHPNCDLQMKRGHTCCGRHWNQLPREMLGRFASARGQEARGAMRIEMRDYFLANMRGKHEITICRTKDCNQRIIFLQTRNGKLIPVNEHTVAADDDQFDKDRHEAHFSTCTNSDGHRRRDKR